MKTMISTVALSLALLCAPATLAADEQGDVTLMLTRISALDQTGQPAPASNEACQAEFGMWLGQTVTSNYTINPDTMMMSAVSTISDVDVRLFPLGIQGIYAFMSDGVPPPLAEQRIIRVLFQISIGYDHPESRIMTSLNDTVNCLIES
jgi:hypothetical protein